MAAGLLVTALINLVLGFSTSFAIVASLGWQWGFRGAAVLSVICTLTVWNVRAE